MYLPGRREVIVGHVKLAVFYQNLSSETRGDDRLYLDERLYDLRIRSLTSVRMLWEQSERVRAQGIKAPRRPVATDRRRQNAQSAGRGVKMGRASKP